MTKVIAVTGATGKVGKAVSILLLNNGLKVHAIGRNPQKLMHLKEMGAEIFTGNMDDTDFLMAAFEGSDGLLAIVPDNFNEIDFKGYKNQIASNIVSCVSKSRIKYIVAISSIGAGLNSVGPIEALYNMEQQFKSLTYLNVIALRPAFYMENLFASIPMITNAGINGAGFIPDLTFPMVSVIDVAKTAAEYLISSDFKGFQIKELIGPRDYTMQKATSTLGQAIGKPQLKYIQLPLDQIRNALSQNGFSSTGIEALIESIEAHNSRRIQSTVKRSKENTTKTTFDEFASNFFAKEYHQQFRENLVT